jgi:hypothetical protein
MVKSGDSMAASLRLDSWRGEIRSQVTEKAEILDSDVLVEPEQSQVVGRQWDGN